MFRRHVRYMKRKEARTLDKVLHGDEPVRLGWQRGLHHNWVVCSNHSSRMR